MFEYEKAYWLISGQYECSIAGWGRMNEYSVKDVDDDKPNILQDLHNMRIQDFQTCANAYWNKMSTPLQPYHYCAGKFGKDSCVVSYRNYD